MTVTAAMTAEVRRMTNEPTSTTYSDVLLGTIIARYPRVDERGEKPYTWDTSTEPPTQDANDNWIATYDLNMAASIIWGEKAAVVADDFQFSADGGSYNRAQVIAQYQQRERSYFSRKAVGTITQRMEPPPDQFSEVSVVGNLPEPD